MTLRRAVVLAVVLLVLAAGLWTAGWFYVADRARGRVTAWVEAEQTAGNTISYRALEVGGFPFRVEIAIDQPEYGTPAYRWRGPALAILVLPWRLDRLGFETAGSHQLDIAMDGETETVHLTTERADGEATFDPDGTLTAFEGDFRSLAIGVEKGPAYRLNNLRVEGRVPADPGPAPDATVLELAFAGDQIALPADQALLGPQIERLAASLAFNGRLPDQPLIPALAAWRDTGGAIDLANISLRWGPLSVEGDGTVALDNALQPLAASSLHVSGYNETLDRIAASGAIPPDTAAATKFALSLIAKAPSAGGPYVATVPVSIQSQRVFVGPIEVARLRPIRWE